MRRCAEEHTLKSQMGLPAAQRPGDVVPALCHFMWCPPLSPTSHCLSLLRVAGAHHCFFIADEVQSRVHLKEEAPRRWSETKQQQTWGAERDGKGKKQSTVGRAKLEGGRLLASSAHAWSRHSLRQRAGEGCEPGLVSTDARRCRASQAGAVQAGKACNTQGWPERGWRARPVCREPQPAAGGSGLVAGAGPGAERAGWDGGEASRLS